jgi:hypothetical protein
MPVRKSVGKMPSLQQRRKRRETSSLIDLDRRADSREPQIHFLFIFDVVAELARIVHFELAPSEGRKERL